MSRGQSFTSMAALPKSEARTSRNDGDTCNGRSRVTHLSRASLTPPNAVVALVLARRNNPPLTQIQTRIAPARANATRPTSLQRNLSTMTTDAKPPELLKFSRARLHTGSATSDRMPESLLSHLSQLRQTLTTISAEVICPDPALHATRACNGNAKRNENAVCPGETVWNVICSCVLCRDMHCEEITVTRNTNSAVENNGLIGKSRRSKFESSSYRPTAFESAEAFGGFEYFPFRLLPLWPSTLIRLFEQEEE
jgi:hypothetical protein